MSGTVIVHKNRTNKLQVFMGFDVSADTFASEIRTEPDVGSTLICAWTVGFLTTGTDGKLLLTLDDSVTEDITYNSGYMDLKRTSGGEPYAVFDSPLEVIFRGAVTE